jgi:hypothetical protein
VLGKVVDWGPETGVRDCDWLVRVNDKGNAVGRKLGSETEVRRLGSGTVTGCWSLVQKLKSGT